MNVPYSTHRERREGFRAVAAKDGRPVDREQAVVRGVEDRLEGKRERIYSKRVP